MEKNVLINKYDLMVLHLHIQHNIYQSNINSPFIEVTIKGGLSESPYWMMKRPGITAPILKWECFVESKEEIR